MTGSKLQVCPNCGRSLRPTALFCAECGTAVMSSVSNALQISIEQTLASMKPGQAEVLRRCAIPRWFDVEILAVLRDRDDNNQKILDQLVSYSFVRQLGEGRYAYMEDVRNYLLDDWRTRPDDLRPIQKRLYNYFERRMGSTMVENRASWLREIVTYDLLLASTTAAKDQQGSNDENPWIMTQSTVNARVDRALLRFRSLFEGAFNSYRMAEAEALLVAAEEQINILSPRIRDWLVFYRGKMNFVNLKLDQAQVSYQTLMNESEIDPELQVLTAINLGDAQVEASLWSAAIESYQKALALPKIEPAQIADAHLGIADAYNEIAISSGGWLLTKVHRNPVMRFFTRLLEFFLTLPMWILVSSLRRLGAAVPPASILARYQNWLLARILRASRDEIDQAYAIFKERNDLWSQARCQMRLIDIDILFGNIKQAVAMSDELLKNTQNEDSYRKARIDLTVARAFAADKQFAKAEERAASALKVFQAVDDGRWEARTQTLIGRMALDQGQTERALTAFKEGLDRARSIGSVLGRERLLYELRVWQRQSINYPREVTNIIEQEPAQRFVNRFPRFLLPHLQIGQIAIFPLIVILAAIVAPTVDQLGIITTSSNFLLPSPLEYVFPWYRLIVAPLIMLFIAAAAYALLGLVILWRMPLEKIKQNQPDLIIMRPGHLVHYDHHGNKAHEIAWEDVTSVISSNRSIWRTPAPTFSRSFVQSKHQPRLRIDGVISWYRAAQEQLLRRSRNAGAQFTQRNFDISLLRSPSGAMIIIGAVLLALNILDANGLTPSLAYWLPATLYAVMQQIAYSGVLIIAPMLYWTIIRPLRIQREYELSQQFPYGLAVVGFVIILLFLVTNGSIVSIPIFSITLFLTGLVLLAEAAYQILLRRGVSQMRRRVMQALYTSLILVGLLLVAAPIRREFYHARAIAYEEQNNSRAASSDRFKELAQDSLFFSPPMDLVRATWYSENARWADAEALYQQVINDPEEDPFMRAMAYHNLSITKLELCSTKGCSAEDLKQIDALQQRAQQNLDQSQDINKVDESATRSAMYEGQGVAYRKIGLNDVARSKLQQALNFAKDNASKQSIQDALNALPK